MNPTAPPAPAVVGPNPDIWFPSVLNLNLITNFLPKVKACITDAMTNIRLPPMDAVDSAWLETHGGRMMQFVEFSQLTTSYHSFCKKRSPHLDTSLATSVTAFEGHMLTEKHTIIGTTPRMRSAPPCTVLQSKH
jgi:hypothetical protein